MEQFDKIDAILHEGGLTLEERQTFIEALESDPDLARSYAGWQQICAHLRSRLPETRWFVLYSLVSGGHAGELNEEESEEIRSNWRDVDRVVESHPGFAEAAIQIEQDRQDFLECWAQVDRPTRKLPSWSLRIAAVIAILGVCFVAVLMLRDTDTALQTIAAASGEYERVLLPDGSVAHLNGPATIQFDERDFERGVTFTGQAFFDIMHQSDPFTVQTSEAFIHVLGTRFGVRSQQDTTQVVLESGRVEVASKAQGSQTVMLEPGQMTKVTSDAPPEPSNQVELEDALNWTGFIFLRQTQLNRAAVLLSEGRNVRVEVDPSLANETVTGTFAPDAEIEEILNALALALGAEVHTEGRVFRIAP
jgi:ferric-dicitrate binding protein FerR (iron transport regulator)